jgi:hypothetical protein
MTRLGSLIADLRAAAPRWGRLPTIAVALFGMCVASTTALAQPHTSPKPATQKADKDKPKDEKPTVVEKAGGDKKTKNFDFTGIDLNGRMRTPQLLYFLERANEELERASLEKRSFIPHMVRSVEETEL